MSLKSNIESGLIELSTAVKALRVMVTGSSQGSLSTLTTTTKTSIIAALNELDAEIAAVAASSAGINDTTTATTTTWSSSKTSTAIADAAAGVKTQLLGGAGAAYDTLAELKALLDASDSADDAALAAINTALGARLRIDAPQGLTSGEQAQGRSNIDVFSKAEIGDINTDFAAVVQAALA